MQSFSSPVFPIVSRRAIGVENGKTRLPAKHSSHTVTRTEDPALSWAAIATVSSVGLVCAGFAAGLAWSALRRRR